MQLFFFKPLRKREMHQQLTVLRGYWLFTVFFFFPLGLIALSGTSSRILNCAGDNGQPYLISDFSGNTSDSPKKCMFAVGFGEIDFIKLRWAPCIPGWLRVVFLLFLNHK